MLAIRSRFVPPDINKYGTQADYNSAMQEARQMHDKSVREHRAREAISLQSLPILPQSNQRCSMAIDDDLPEYTGADKTTLAVPKAKINWSVTDTPSPIDPDEQAPRITPYNPPAPGSTHPKHAVLSVALRLDKAEHVLTKANIELTTAARRLRDAELAEAEAERVFMAEFPDLPKRSCCANTLTES